jgi:hypothetical protein
LGIAAVNEPEVPLFDGIFQIAAAGAATAAFWLISY